VTALHDAPLVDVLLHGLVGSDEDTVDALLAGVRADLDVVARLAGDAGQLAVAQSLDGLRHRIEAAIELRRREPKSRPRKRSW